MYTSPTIALCFAGSIRTHAMVALKLVQALFSFQYRLIITLPAACSLSVSTPGYLEVLRIDTLGHLCLVDGNRFKLTTHQRAVGQCRSMRSDNPAELRLISGLTIRIQPQTDADKDSERTDQGMEISTRPWDQCCANRERVR